MRCWPIWNDLLELRVTWTTQGASDCAQCVRAEYPGGVDTNAVSEIALDDVVCREYVRTFSGNQKPPSDEGQSGALSWRKGRDSNPRSVLPDTRFPGARTRPTMRPFQESGSVEVARRRRGRDSNPRWLNTTLLFESSTLNRSDTSPRRIVPKPECPCQGNRENWCKQVQVNEKAARTRAAVVRLAGFEPAAFGSATQRSIP